MNNRQKAKHFKELYERTLPNKTWPIIVKRNPLERYKCVVIARSREEAIEKIVQHFKDFLMLSDNTVYCCGDEYDFTFWIKKDD